MQLGWKSALEGGRFDIVSRLGAGGMGEVFKAWDNQSGTLLALKRLPILTPSALYRFKNEFRSLQDFWHPNVVRLGELFEDDGIWFYSMELIDGCNLLTHVGAGRQALARPPSTMAVMPTLDAGPERMGSLATQEVPASRPGRPQMPGPTEQTLHAPTPPSAPRYDADRLYPCLSQLASAIDAIHRFGKLHRDIKPANVMVTGNGRVVLLDLGLVTDLVRPSNTTELGIVGTAHYMAPEQTREYQILTEATDWYSFGVVLYQCLTSALPHRGDAIGVIVAKRECAPEDVRIRAPECPESLADLCMQLLATQPERRPGYRHIAEVLDGYMGTGSSPSSRAATTGMRQQLNPAEQVQADSLLGRENELSIIATAYREVQEGTTPCIVHVSGPSGMGKSALISHFMRHPSPERPHLALMSRCYEQEFVPFRAFDGIVDTLSSFLLRLPEPDVAALMPRHVSLLLRLFPVLGQVDVFRKSSREHASAPSQESRHLAFAAMRELMDNLVQHGHAPVLWIDDFQSADSDSLALLEHLLRPPGPPKLLLIVSSRRSDLDLSDFACPQRALTIGPLDERASTELAHRLLSHGASISQERVPALVAEAKGHPMFLLELVQFALSQPELEGMHHLLLDHALWKRAQFLDPRALALLQLICLIHVPIGKRVLSRSSYLARGQLEGSLNQLRRLRFVTHLNDGKLVKPFHDRTREAVVAHLPDHEKTELHQRIAGALQAEDAEPRLLLFHLEMAGEGERAARMALAVAASCRDSFAYERAAHFYRDALRLWSFQGAERQRILVSLGDTYVAMGRGPDAAEAYREAARVAVTEVDRLECRINVAHQLVTSGHLDRGLTVLRELFQQQGLPYPRTQVAAGLGILWCRVRLRFMKIDAIEYDDRQSADILAKLALYKAATQGLVLIDSVRAAYWVSRALLLALEARHFDYTLYFMTLEGDFRIAESPHAASTRRFVDTASEMLASVEQPDELELIFASHWAARVFLSLEGGDRVQVPELMRTNEQLAARGVAPWELAAGRTFLLLMLRRLGSYGQLAQHHETFAEDARQRGDVYMEATMVGICNIVLLVRDDPDGAQQALDTSSWPLFLHGYHVQHWYRFHALMELHLYRGQPPDSRIIVEHWPRLQRSFIPQVGFQKADALWLIGRLDLAFGSDIELPFTVDMAVWRLSRMTDSYAATLAGLLHASRSHRRGHRRASQAGLRAAAAGAKEMDMAAHTAVVHVRQGQLDNDRALLRQGLDELRGLGVARPARMLALMSPGFRGLSLDEAEAGTAGFLAPVMGGSP